MSSKEKSTKRADVVVFITLPASALRTELLVNNNEEIPSGTIGNRMIAYFAKYQLAIQLYTAGYRFSKSFNPLWRNFDI